MSGKGRVWVFRGPWADPKRAGEFAEKASFEVMKTLTETLPDTVPDLGFNVDENGWKASSLRSTLRSPRG